MLADILKTRLTELERVLIALEPKARFDEIDTIMLVISAQHKITPDELHNQFVAKFAMTPDEFIENNSN